MKITQIVVKKIPIQLNTPFKTALREVQFLDVIRVFIHFDNGIIGIGEAAPTKVITGDTEESIITDIKDVFTPFLLGKEVTKDLNLLAEMDLLLEHHTSPKAAIDIAIHDALAKDSKLPLYKFLGGQNNELVTDYTISIGQKEQMIATAQEKVVAGFSSLKVKLGLDDVTEEIAKIKSMNEALEGKVSFRIDANQGWRPEDAVEIINQWQDIPIDFIEQPVKADDFAGLKLVTENTKIPIMADESVFSLADAKELIRGQYCDLINIKLMKTGGLRQAKEIYQLANENKIGCMVGSMIEGYAGLAAAAHFTCGMGKMDFVDLDVPFMWQQKANDSQTTGMKISAGKLTLTDRIGLGITQ